MEKMFDAMEYLEKDPIIEYYINFSSGIPRTTIKGRKLPNYSETLLRLAVRHALGSTRPVDANILQLYRQLILFYFSETYTVVDELLHIMPCFSESELLQCFENYETIRGEWAAFTRNNLMYYIRKRAFFAIISEWTRRYLKIDRNLDSVTLRNQAFRIHSFFKWGSKGIVQWLRSFETNTLKSNWESKSNAVKPDPITHQDLKIDVIALDVKDKLHPLIVSELEGILKTWSVILSSDNEESEAIADSESFACSLAKRTKIEKRKSVDEEETECGEMDSLVEVYELSATETDGSDDKNEDNRGKQNEENDNTRESGKSEVTTESDEDNDNNEHNISIHIEDNYENEDNYVNVDHEDYNDEDNMENGIEISEKLHHEVLPSVLCEEQATKYISALQAYMVVNGLYDAIPLLDRVDSILRESLGLGKGTIS